MSMRRKPPWKRRRNRLLMGLLVLIVLGAGAFRMTGWRSASILDEKIRQLQAKGVPVYLHEYTPQNVPPPPRPDSPSRLSAYQLYKNAHYVQLSEALRWEPGLSADFTERAKEALREFDEVMAQAHQHIRRSDGSIDFEALRNIKEWFDTSQGDAGLLFLAEALGGVPPDHPQQTLEALLLGVQLCWSYHNLSDAILTLLHQGLFTDAELEQLGGLVGELRPDARQELDFNRVLGLHELGVTEEYVRSHGRLIFDRYVPGTTKFLLDAGEVIGYSTQQKIRFLDNMDLIQSCYALPRPEGIAQMRPMATRLYKAIIPSTSGQITRSSISGFANQVIHEAHINAMTASIALERYYRGHGQYPGHWTELVPDYLPAPPDDPCAGAPLRYRAANGRYLVYSIGLDQDDDQGRHQQYLSRLWENGDYVLLQAVRPPRPQDAP